jgi:pimeloyl-ACP methyl ester carboxylesterase
VPPAHGRARELRFAYLHGFASGPWSFKGRRLAESFANEGLRLELPDLNLPSFDELTPSGMLAAVDALDAASGTEAPCWAFIGSSLGGWVAARWAELHPHRVARLLLLAPAFDLPNLWRRVLSGEQLRQWEARGWLEVPDGTGRTARLRWEFFADCARQPPFPSPRCPVLVVHGRRDETVPLAGSEAYAARHPGTRLEVLDDDHELIASLSRVRQLALDWLAGGESIPARVAGEST